MPAPVWLDSGREPGIPLLRHGSAVSLLGLADVRNVLPYTMLDSFRCALRSGIRLLLGEAKRRCRCAPASATPYSALRKPCWAPLGHPHTRAGDGAGSGDRAVSTHDPGMAAREAASPPISGVRFSPTGAGQLACERFESWLPAVMACPRCAAAIGLASQGKSPNARPVAALLAAPRPDARPPRLARFRAMDHART
jgi:hypothetical protein